MKKYMAVFVALGLFISSAVSQNVTSNNIVDSVCIYNICVEVVDTKPVIVTEHFLVNGDSKVLYNQLFFAVRELPCWGNFTQPVNEGPQWYNHRYYKDIWWLPIANGINDERKMLTINSTTRIIGIPLAWGATSLSHKVYQMNPGKTDAFVFKNGKLSNVVRNLKPTYKFAKGTEVAVLTAEP